MPENKGIYTFSEVGNTGKDKNGYTISEWGVVVDMAYARAWSEHNQGRRCSLCLEWAILNYRIDRLMQLMGLAA